MKKIIAISVMFVLLTGAAFAVDLGGTVFGHVNVLEGTTGKTPSGESAQVKSSGNMDRLRLDGGGEAGDGAFEGYIRFDVTDIDSAYAAWKPIDQFKFRIGWNGDGFWGKEGVTGWGFNQIPYDCGIAVNPGIWGGGEHGGFASRYVFFGGVGNKNAFLEIKPMDMLGINIAIPFFNGGETADVFKQSVVQFDVNIEGIGNIALTYVGGRGYKEAEKPKAYYIDPTDPDGGGKWIVDNTGNVTWQANTGSAGKWAIDESTGSNGYDDPGTIFLYFGGTFGSLGVDFGLGYHLAYDGGSQPIGVGLGLKYAADSFGVKFRVVAALAGDEKVGPYYDATWINTSVLPYFNVSDSITAFVNAGLAMAMPKEGDSITGWYFNPYLRVGAEWGPTFYFGIKASSDGVKDADDKTSINWSIPVALVVSF